jgi:hypothetical protein
MFRNMRIAAKLGMGFAVLNVLLIVANVFSIHNLGKNDESIKTIVNDRYPKVIMAHNIVDQINLVARSLRNMVIFTNPADVQKEAERIEGARKTVTEEIEKLQKVVQTDKGKEILKAIVDARVAYTEPQKEVMKLVQEGKKKEAGEALLTKVRPVQQVYFDKVGELIKYQGELMEQEGQKGEQVYQSSRNWIIFLAVISTLIGCCIAYWVTRSITKPVGRVVEGLTDGAHQVASASAQVSGSSQSLAEGASEQAAALEETSASMEQMSSMTQQNADHVHQAKTIMGEANRVVEEVNQHMGHMAEAIQEITKGSEETSKIIKTIDEIAFQTNLLALNAAVEAARAGEAGAGFAVVADEVRNLAMRASEAAKNTNSLIESIIKSIQNGKELTGATQAAFKKNMEISGKMGKLIEEIAAASQEQAQGIAQVNKAVGEMDKVTQQNAANAQQSAAASEQMNAQAEQMKEFVGELVALVGRKGNGKGIPPQNSPSQTGKQLSLSQIGQKTRTALRKTFRAPGEKGMAVKVNRPHQRKEVKPEQVIPFDDGEFKEF